MHLQNLEQSSDDSSSSTVTDPGATTTGQTTTRRLYFAGFGIVYLISFLSLWCQVNDLIGPSGLLPAHRYFSAVRDRYGAEAYWDLPSLCWIDSSDLTLHLLCGVGSALCLALIAGIAPRIVLALLWMIYLSLSTAGQTFLSFQWDTLLLEMTVCSLFYAPRGLRPDWKDEVTTISAWPLWGLVFKLMFLSGVTKLLSGDTSWMDGTALQFHYFTQPIPSWVAWYMSQLPRGFHQISLALMFLVECGLPFLVFAGRRGRIVFGMATILLMIVVESTGNFGFFNLQTIVLCLPLLDDKFLRWLFPYFPKPHVALPTPNSTVATWRNFALPILVGLVLGVSLLTIVAEISSTARMGRMPELVLSPIRWSETLLLSWGRPVVLEQISSLRTINGYGLFRVMTVQRNEFIIETSDDGLTWTAAEFLYKPGRVNRAPPIVAPHMPRLDWQMWFAALNPQGNQNWLRELIDQILNGRAAAARLMGHPEWIAHPPRRVRLAFYQYSFTTAEQRRENGAWWNRSFIGKSNTFTRESDPPPSDK